VAETATKKETYFTCNADGCAFGCAKHENEAALNHLNSNPGHHLNENYGKYVQKADGDFVCRDCGADIMGAQVAHAIHDGPFPLSGSGRCEYETVPYCPKCDPLPSFHGTPITH
jgi:hypothetical protein